ncbi:hypothetical protein CVT24_005625 [Panaeolus cyanescens]|uniref:Uncharacterized protein n=1 Tax=Panaeolus cyanescens TaxID=181874 RepID=A0A409YY47_9AGAR|nr:hypothetical protein CVT24_005625 [Panaeolus cyanescens]
MSSTTLYPTFSVRTTTVKKIPPDPVLASPENIAKRMAPHRTIPETIPRPCPDDQWFVNKPKSRIALFLWRKQIWLESTFALTVCEPWEEIVVLTIFAILGLAMFLALAVYLPQQLVFMKKRAVYYLWGEETVDLMGSS